MIKTNIGVLFSLITFLFYFQVRSQNTVDSKPILVVLNDLEQQFDCNFSYINNELQSLSVVPASKDLTFKEHIDYLSQNTLLNFTFLSQKNIAIRLKKMPLEICGIIKSKNQSNPLSKALIQTSTNSTISNDNGGFRLLITHPDQSITISYLGFQSITLSIFDFLNQNCATIYLIPSVEFLNKIILTDYITQGISTGTDGGVTINYDDFGILPGLIEADVLQTMQALPGILSVNETVSDINVRGGTNDQNLILWDGIKMYHSSHFFGLISAFNPYLTQKATLFKNGSSAEYGDGVSSVIDMQTSHKINDRLKTSIGMNMISTDAYVDTPIGTKSSIQVAMRTSINEVIKTPTYQKYFDKVFQNSEVLGGTNQEFNFYDTSIRWLYKITPKDLIKVNGIIMQNKLVFQETGSFNAINIVRESSLQQNNMASGIYYKRKWNHRLTSKLMTYGTHYKINAINADVLNNQRLLQENEVLESGVKFHLRSVLNNNLKLLAGYQFNETGITDIRDINNPTFRDLVKEVMRTQSVYSEVNYKSSNNRTYLQIGARLNRFDKFDDLLFEPRLSITHNFWNHFSAQVMSEIKSQTTAQVIDLQDDFLGIENKKWILANQKDIPILKSKQASIGINYTFQNWLVTTDIYYKDVSGIIARSQGFQNQFRNSRDHGSYKVKGIDFLMSKRFQKLQALFSYSYAINDYSFTTLNPPNFPNNLDIRNNLNITLSYLKKNLKLSTSLNWHSGKPTTYIRPEQPEENTAINYFDPNSSTIQDYLRVDISGTYTFQLSKKIQAYTGVSIWNLTNQHNILNNYFQKNTNNELTEFKDKGLSITPNMVFRIHF